MVLLFKILVCIIFGLVLMSAYVVYVLKDSYKDLGREIEKEDSDGFFLILSWVQRCFLFCEILSYSTLVFGIGLVLFEVLNKIS